MFSFFKLNNKFNSLQTSFSSQHIKMAEQYVGKWKLVDSDNFDEYMKEVGVGFLKRKAGAAVKPVLSFEVTGNHWKMVSKSTFTTWTCEFDLGKEYELETPDGRKMKSTFTFENAKLIEVQKKINADDKDSRIERYIDFQGNLIIECVSGGVKAVRKYEKM